MCFSIHIDKDIKRIAKAFSSEIAFGEFEKLKKMQNYMDSLTAQQVKEGLGLSRIPKSNPFKIPEDDGIVYPNYFAPILISNNGNRYLTPMRYRLRPKGSRSEIPSKFNVFNARLDSLLNKKTWKPLVGRNHGLVPFNKFYEWVEENGEKRLVSFKPSTKKTMWAPCLWDYWESPDRNISFRSFAIITTDPPVEIQEVGHDRCPIFLDEKYITNWLSPGQDSEEYLKILEHKEKVIYETIY